MALKYINITATMRVSSCRIGGGEGQIGIGGVEENLRVLRDPVDGYPYIPGSSLKGKVRNLLELDCGRDNGKDKNGRAIDRGEPCMCGSCNICRVFGAHKNTRHKLGPTRLLVRDALLTPEAQARLIDLNEQLGLDCVEVKTENMVNRRTGTAQHPRTGERTLRGLEYQLKLSVRILDGDNEKDIMGLIRRGFRELLPKDAIGSSGSRGYGEVEILNWEES